MSKCTKSQAHELLQKQAEQMNLRQAPHLAARLWDTLFQPTTMLQTRMQQAAEHLGIAPHDDQDGTIALPWTARGQLGFLGIHFRAGNESARLWWDPSRHALSSLPDFLQCAAWAEKELGLPLSTPWFLSTDTISALEAPEVQSLRASGKVRVLDGEDGWKLAHVDRSHANLGLQGFVDSYAAYLLLASAQVLILSRSFFGETAAEIGAVPHVYFAEGCVQTDMRSS